MNQDFANKIRNLIAGELTAEEKDLNFYSEDYSIFKVKPKVVIFPKNRDDIKKVVNFVREERSRGENISITARSAGTDMSGGPLNDSIILVFTKYFNNIKEIGENYAVVEPGVYFKDLEKELAKRGLLYPPYPASKDLCALGGMINNNSGGEKTLSYGKTEDYVEELTMIMSDGEEHTFRKLSSDELNIKLKENSFEGKIYRELFNLITKNYDLIQKAKPNVSKNSSGFSLWNVWDGKFFDINKILVGSQGTLGILVSAKIRVVKAKKYNKLLVIFAKKLDFVPELVREILEFNPESIESYDNKTMKLAMKFFPDLLKLMKGSFFRMIWKFLPSIFLILKNGYPEMILLVSFGGDDEKNLNRKVLEVAEVLKKYPVSIRNVKDNLEAEEYWMIRRQSFKLLHSKVKNLYAAPFIDDIIVDPKYMPELLPKVNSILEKYKKELIYTIAGHPGNGNFHIIPLVNLKDEKTRKIILEVMDEVYKLVLKYNGSLTAEHNDGIIRTPYLKDMYGERVVSLFAEVKRIFDPLNIFNPHKKVGGDINDIIKYMKYE